MNDGKFRKLDLSIPSKELLAEAYALAKQVWDLAPWKQMEERQILAIHFADGQQGIVSVMGTQGQHLAIAIYPTFSTYMQIRSVDQHDEQSALDAFYATNHLQLAFGPASHLHGNEMRDIKASGFNFRRGYNPAFTSYVSGFVDDRMGADELTQFIRFLRAFLAFYDQHGPDAVAVNDRPYKLLTTWTEDMAGNWAKGENDYSAMPSVSASPDESLIDRVAALRVRKKQEFFLEVAAFPIPAGQAPNGRGKMSRCVIAVEGATQFILGATIVETPDDREFDWTPAIEFALNTIIDLGFRPSKLAAFGCGLYCALKNLTATRFKGTEFMPYNPCDSAHKIFAELQDRFLRDA